MEIVNFARFDNVTVRDNNTEPNAVLKRFSANGIPEIAFWHKQSERCTFDGYLKFERSRHPIKLGNSHTDSVITII